MKKAKKARKVKRAAKTKKIQEYQPFCFAMEKDSYLKSLRQEHADVTPHERKMAAQWEYDEEMAADLFNFALMAIGERPDQKPKRPAGFLSLAIDPLHAPALLTVGSSEYQHGLVEEAMELFLTLTTLPEDEEDLHEIIDKAGDFLLDSEDFENALELYLAAESAYPHVAVYAIGSGYCYHHFGDMEEAVRKVRRAVELEPENYVWLNDLGFALLEAGLLEEAEEVLKRSISLSPDEYWLPRKNLERLFQIKQQMIHSNA